MDIQVLNPSPNLPPFRHLTDSIALDKPICHLSFLNNVIIPKLNQDPEKFEFFTDKDIKKLIHLCTKINENQKHTLQEILESNLKIYNYTLDKIKTNDNLATKATAIIEILKDYSETITIILQYRRDKLETKLAKIKQTDLDDLIRSVYTTLLVFVCILFFVTLKSCDYTKTFQKIIDLGFKSAKNIDSYSDTLDIITNPHEL